MVRSPALAANFLTKRFEGLRYSRIGLIRPQESGSLPVLTAFPSASTALHSPGKAERASMLPGFRFLFAAIVLSMSVLVFGLGAAALLRTAHEQFASIPSRRAPPEPVFAQHIEPPMPTLALLRFEPPAPEKVPDSVQDTAVTIALPEPV